MRANGVSLFIGLAVTFFLCLIWPIIIESNDPMYFWPGILAIIAIVFLAGLKSIPVQHAGVLKILGKRWHINFYEGWYWIPLFASVDIVNRQLDIVDVPLIKIFTKNNVEVGVDIWVYLSVEDPFTYLNLKNPQETIKTSVVSKCNEAISEFVNDNTDKQCRTQPDILQQKIKEKMTQEEKKLGVEISDIDIRPILPTDQFKQEYAEDFKKDIRTKRYAKDAKKIKKVTPGLTDNEVANTTQIVEGIVKKEIKEEKKTIKLDVEPEILKIIAEFLPKKKSGGKK